MSINFETAIEMQKICTGETRELTRGQLAGEVLDIDVLTKGFKAEKASECRAFYEKLINDDTKKAYDIDLLLEETDAIKKEFDDFLAEHRDDGSLQALIEEIDEFFMTPPFEGLDSIEYGVNEVCVLSILEYFKWKTSDEHDHELIRKDYRDSIAERTYEEVGDHWIGVYDDLQKRYDKLWEAFDGDRAFEHKLTACSIVAVSAIKDQDEFTLDMVQAGAVQKGTEIADAYLDEKYDEDESVFTNNVIKLYEFVWRSLKG